MSNLTGLLVSIYFLFGVVGMIATDFEYWAFILLAWPLAFLVAAFRQGVDFFGEMFE